MAPHDPTPPRGTQIPETLNIAGSPPGHTTLPAQTAPIMTSGPDAVTMTEEEIARALARHGIAVET